jgi:hypothetical protein
MMEHDTMRHENEIAQADYLAACRERAIAAEVDRIKDLTVSQLVEQTGLVWVSHGTLRRNANGLSILLEDLIEDIAEANIDGAKA